MQTFHMLEKQKAHKNSQCQVKPNMTHSKRKTTGYSVQQKYSD